MTLSFATASSGKMALRIEYKLLIQEVHRLPLINNSFKPRIFAKKKIGLFPIVPFLLLFCLFAQGASSGRPGEESEGTIRISLAIQPSIRINTATSINLRIVNRSVDAQFTEALCITGNFGGKYTVTATGNTVASSGGAPTTVFSLLNTEQESLAYRVAYRGDPGSNHYDQLHPGIPSPLYQLNTGDNCNDDDAFRITFKSEDLENARSGLYKGQLTLLVSPV